MSPITAVLVGAVVVASLVVLSDYRIGQFVDRLTALDRFTGEVVLGVTRSHLWLEEHLAADDAPGLEERIYAELDAARRSCATLGYGGLIDAGQRATLDAGLVAGQPADMNLCDGLDLLREITGERLADSEASGPGTALDERYNEIFSHVVRLAEGVDVAIETQVAQDREALSAIALGLAMLVLAAFALMGAFVRRATRRLERLSVRHATTLDAVPEGLLRVDAAGTIVFANAAAGALVGRAATDLVGLRAQELLRLDDAAGCWDGSRFAAVLRGEIEVGAFDVTCRHVDGSTFVAACTVRTVDIESASAGVVVVLRDETESRAIAAERDEMASIVSASSDLALIGLPDGRLRWLNEAGRALLGFEDEEDITAFRIEDLFSAEEMERVYREVMPIVARDHEWAGMMTLRARDGIEIPVAATQYAHHDAHGERRYVSGIMRDLRPGLEEERNLRESERRLTEAQRLARLGSWEMDLASRAVVWSEELHRIFGTDPAVFEPMYGSFLAAVHGDDRSMVEAAVAEAERNHRYACEFRIIRPDGGVRVVDAHGAIVADDEGKPVRMVGAAQDVTELRQVDRLKNEFMSVVSHELRTPLTSVHGALRLLQAGLLTTQPEQAQRMLDIAERNTDRLTRLINDILDVERLTSGKIDLQPEAVRVAEVAVTSVETMQAMAEDAGVQLAVDPTTLVLWADPHRIEQVLTNLLSNAIKFSPPGGKVRVSAEAVDGVAVLRVADEGRGIPADRLEHIFERFQHVDPGDTRDKGGTGLGLAICRGIVEQSGGRIWAESEPASGATFVVTLPLEATATNQGGAASRGTVLVCDNDEIGREAVAGLLATRGYTVVQAGDGETAVELATAHLPAVIVLDLLMPGLDGWQTAARLKARPETRSTPIIILSVVPEADAHIDVGNMQTYVEKCSGPQRLLDAVERAVSSRPRLLLVEDDQDLAGILARIFQQHGVEVVHAPNGAAALELCEQLMPDLVVLDLGLPDIDGFTVVDSLRAHEHLGAVPLLVYTAADLSRDQHRRLAGQTTSVLVKSRVSPVAFERHVLALIDRITDVEAGGNR